MIMVIHIHHGTIITRSLYGSHLFPTLEIRKNCENCEIRKKVAAAHCYFHSDVSPNSVFLEFHLLVFFCQKTEFDLTKQCVNLIRYVSFRFAQVLKKLFKVKSLADLMVPFTVLSKFLIYILFLFLKV